ncbi:hypothetical protein [Arthrobacter sp. 9AX]|uniref:hypothetical protein n=1 Tax=Arthrobacter sp. 9AX TaxID=2653131 RepID=UPI001F202D22|nr:hypothetical protein [Arthrobacter sp. 9AX]
MTMRDGSAIWVWVDGGRGRRLIHWADDIDVKAAPNPLRSDGGIEDDAPMKMFIRENGH